MALAIKDRVKETTTTTGTGTYTLGGAVTGFETFTTNLSNADTTYYACTDNTNFEVGIGTFTSSGTTLARTTILASSNSNSAVNWSSGTRTIFMTYPADKAVFKDASDNINGTFVGNITGNVTGNTSGTAATVTTAAQSNITSLGTLTTLTVDNVIINGTTIGHTDDTDLITLADGVATVAGEISVTTLDIGGTNVTSTAAELNILDGVTSTASEINLIDGDTARGTTAVASGDGILINDGGTMRMTNVDTVSTYFSSHNVGGSNIVTTGALNSGSITSGFGTIDTGSSAITTTGLISGGSLDIDDVLINGTTIGHTDDTDLITLADGVVTVAGEISVTTLDIGGTNVTSTASEINLIDGGTARGTTAVASGDGILINDGGTMRMTNVDTVSTYFASHSVGGSNIVTTGALNSGSITSGFGTIDTGSSAITTTGLISGGSLDIDDVLINGTTIGHTDDTDLMTVADGLLTVAGEISVTTLDIGGTNVTATAAELNYVDGVTSAIQTQMDTKASKGFATAMAIAL